MSAGRTTTVAELPDEMRTPSRSDDGTVAVAEADAVVHLAGTLALRRIGTLEHANLGTVSR